MLNAARVRLLGSVLCILSGCGGEDAIDSAKPEESTKTEPDAIKKNHVAPGDEDFGSNDEPAARSVKPTAPGFRPVASGSAVSPGDNGQPSLLGSIIAGLSGLAGVDSLQNPGQLPESFAAWADVHFELAVRTRSLRLPKAIQIRAAAGEKRSEFVALMKRLLDLAIEPPMIIAAATPSVGTPNSPQTLTRARTRGSRLGVRDDYNVGPPGSFGGRMNSKRRKSLEELEKEDEEEDEMTARLRGNTRPAAIPIEGSGGTRVYYDYEEMSVQEYERRVGIESAASRSAASSSASGTAPTTLSDRQLVQAVLRGLLVIDSAEAWQSLQSVLQGQQDTPLDLKQSCIVVFEEVFGSESINAAMAEELAVSVVNNADHELPAMDLLVSLASRVARVDLHLNDAAVDAQSGNLSYGAAPTRPAPQRNPRRLGGREDFEEEEFEEENFRTFNQGRNQTSRGGGANNQGTGGPFSAAPAPPELTALRLPPDAIQSVVPVFRSTTLIAAVQNQLDDVTDLTSGAPLLALASMLPDQDVRRATYRVFDQNKNDGAEMLRNSGFYGVFARDPGHLLVLKSLPRLRKPKSRGRDTAGPDPALVSWARATWEMVRTLRDQLSESASNADIAWDGQLQPRLYKGTVAEVATELVINDKSDGSDDASNSARVYYTRSSVTLQNARETKAVSEHYENQARGIRRELPDEGILWFDGVRRTPDGLCTTLDVIISKAANPASNAGAFGAGRNSFGNSAAQSGKRFTVETIAIVAADPREAGKPEEAAELAQASEPREAGKPEEAAELAQPSEPQEWQLTSGAYSHRLDDNDNFSPDNEWLVYDTRTDAGGILMGRTIEKVHVRTKEVVTLYKAPDATETGPGIGAVSYHPTQNKVVFIHGLLNHSRARPYDWWRRFGMLFDEAGLGRSLAAEARDVVSPFTPGALRGGTHRHEFSSDGKWIGFTYNDALMAERGKTYNLRTIGVTKLGNPVAINGEQDGANFSGAGTSALVVRVTPDPAPGSDEISRAASDSWIGTRGYKTADGRMQRARAFLGTVYTVSGKHVAELFVVDIPEDLMNPGSHGPLEGTTDIMPMPPRGAVQRRLTHTEDSPCPGFTGNVRSSPDGSILACRAKDRNGIDQVILASPLGGSRRQLTSSDSAVQSDVRWHPNGKHVCFVQGDVIVVAKVASGKSVPVTASLPTGPFAPVWSRDGKTIAFNRRVQDEKSGNAYAQVFVVRVEHDALP